MLINLRNALMAGKRTPTAKDYVQNGLVAMWDGIENAGWGTHDANAATWKDLVGNRDLALSNVAINSDSIQVSSTDNNITSWARLAFSGDQLMNLSSVSIECRLSDYSIIPRDTTTAVNLNVSGYNGIRLGFQGGKFSVQANTNWPGRTVSSISPTEPSYTLSMSCTSGLTKSLYVNSSFVISGTCDLANPCEYKIIYIGRDEASAYDDFVNGKYHNVRIYNRELTASEIARNYNIDKARFNLP